MNRQEDIDQLIEDWIENGYPEDLKWLTEDEKLNS